MANTPSPTTPSGTSKAVVSSISARKENTRDPLSSGMVMEDKTNSSPSNKRDPTTTSSVGKPNNT